MSERRTAWLAALLLALAAYYAVFEGFAPPRRIADREHTVKILDCAGELPAALAVTTERGRIEARRDGARWTTAAGTFGPASFASLAEALCRLPVLDRTPRPEALGEYGLDPPRATVEAVVAGRSETLAIGDATPAGNLGYAKRAGGTEVLTVGAELLAAVERVARAAAP